jgi:hypothetical protein
MKQLLMRQNNNHKNTRCVHTRKLYQLETNETADTLWTRSIEEATKFHSLGGSLKSVQQFLDSEIHIILKDRLNITYEMKNPEFDTGLDRPDEVVKQMKNQGRWARRGGYQQPLPFTFAGQNVRNVLHEDRWVDVMESWTDQRLRSSVGPEGPKCPQFAYFMENTYEAKAFCIDESMMKESTSENEEECHIFSIGSNDQWGV